MPCVSNCTTSIYVGHRGTDREGATMESGQQIEHLMNSSSIIDVGCHAGGGSRLVGLDGDQRRSCAQHCGACSWCWQ